MHPRNPYKTPPDFISLAQAYPPLQQFLIKTCRDRCDSESSGGGTTIDFKNDSALRFLTQAIMLRDFGVQLHIPEDRLCPPVPNRLNYVLWIQDIMIASGIFRTEVTVRAIRGIDIGTGATAIYPLLACSLERDWEIIGTELDGMSYECARRNVSNNLNGRVIIQRAQRNGSILFPLESEAARYDFTMCNPPFYSSPQEMDDLSKEKVEAPNAVCTGSDSEMIYADGGEVGFVVRLVEESIQFQERCRWYTSMLGRMSSVIEIIELFRKRDISNYAITEFVQGRTRRWALGWTFSGTRLPDSISRIALHKSHTLAPYMPLHTTLRQTLRLLTTGNRDAARCLMDVLKAIEGLHLTEHKDTHHSPSFRVEGKENTWSRSARRKRRRRNEAGEEAEIRRMDSVAYRDSTPELVCDVRIIQSRQLETGVGESVEQNGGCGPEHLMGHDHPGYSLECQWIFGRDHRIFETFAGHIGRKLAESIQTG